MDASYIKDQNTRRSALIFGLFFFAANLIGFTAFRYAISQDLFGGDICGFARNTESYFLQYNDIVKPEGFCSKLLSGRDEDRDKSPSAFLWGRLSEKGRRSAERIASGNANDRDKELFVIDLNKSWVDAPLQWPQRFLDDGKGGGVRKPIDSNQEYNVRILARLFPQISAPAYLDKANLPSLADRMWKYLPHIFTLKQPTRYAPLSAIYSTTLHNYLRNAPERLLSAIVVQAVFYALLMVLVFFLAMEVFSSVPWAFFSALLFQAAVSTILSTFTIFSLPYFLVPLVMIAAFLSYLRYERTGRIGYLLGFIALAIAGPWFREFAGLIPFIVLANEVLNFKKGRSILIMFVCALLCAHSIYPSFLTWLIGLNKGEFFGVYAQNNRQQLVTLAMNWMSPGMIFVEVPPILWVVAWLSLGVWIASSKWADLTGEPAFFGIKLSFVYFWGPKMQKLFKGFLIVLVMLIPLFVGWYFFGHYKDQGWQHPGQGNAQGAPLLALILILSLFSLRFNTLIPIYFLMVFLPFMRIGGNTEVHMSFALAPLSIMILLWARKLYQMLREHSGGAFKAIGLAVLSFFFLLGLADQVANLWACGSSQRAAVRVNKEMAGWISGNLERHSIILCNFFNFYDVFYYSDHYFDPYETVENCPMGPSRVVHADRDFERLAEKYFNLAPFYFLANRIPYYEYQKNYHSHKYVNNPPGELEELRRFEVKNVYYYFDPLKFFIMRRFQTLPLYMDWSIDFYYNNTGSMFQRVVSADYTLYRLKDLSRKNAGAPPAGPAPTIATAPLPVPVLVTDHKKYNIVQYSNKFYVVPQSMGSLDLSKEEDRSRAGIFAANSMEEARKLIDDAVAGDVATQVVAEKRALMGPPVLVDEHKKYNIVQYDSRFYAVPQFLGPLDLSEEKNRMLRGIFIKDTKEAAQKLIDEIIASSPQPLAPPQLVARHKRYNIVLYDSRFYALPQSLGPLDLAHEQDRSKPGILIGSSKEEAQRLIDGAAAGGEQRSGETIHPVATAPAGVPQLVAEHKRYNIVYLNDVYYAVPQSLGPMDLSLEANRTRPGILTGSSIKKAKRNIDKAQTAAIFDRLRRFFIKIVYFLAHCLKILFHL